jgi:hypothetical protein
LSQNYSSSLYRGKAIAKTGLYGHDVIFLFAGPAAQEKYYESVVEKTASTSTFTKPDPELIVNSWKKRLEGMMLEKSDSEKDSSKLGATKKINFNIIHFCKNGRYRSGSTTEGKWQIQVTGLETHLTLMGADQSTTDYSLGLAGDRVSLNGVHFKIKKSSECK